jgi:RHS repeat-associated protein
VGNLLSKSGVGNTSYAPPGSPLPHAMTGVSGGSISTTFSCDPNGNQTSGLGRTISYSSYNKPASILVHLNGRVYDPLLARMTSADPTVSDPMNPPGWNRYSYVGNDPLAFTDPSGFSWFSSFFNSFFNSFLDRFLVN